MTKSFTVAHKFLEHLKTAGLLTTKAASPQAKTASVEPTGLSKEAEERLLSHNAGLMYRDPVLARYIELDDTKTACSLASGRIVHEHVATKLASLSPDDFRELAAVGLKRAGALKTAEATSTQRPKLRAIRV